MSEGLRSRQGGNASQTGTQLETTKKTESDAFVRPEPTLYLGGTKRWEPDELEDIIRSSISPKSQYKMASISNNAKKAKDALEEDPYNLHRIIDLGFTYASEVQFDKACNVLIRGWKRAPELKEPQERFNFLMKLSEVSFRNHQFRQAHAVFMDIEEPEGCVDSYDANMKQKEPTEEYYQKKAFQLLGCHVHCEIGDSPKALSIFSKAIEKEEFEIAIKIWAACAIRLKKVGAHEVAKAAVLAKARSGQNHYMDQSRIQTVESWSIMSSNPKETKGWFDVEDGIPPWMPRAAIAFFVLIFIWLLHIAEKSSLRSMKML